MCIFPRKPSQLGKEKSVHLCSGLIDEDYIITDVVHVGFCTGPDCSVTTFCLSMRHRDEESVRSVNLNFFNMINMLGITN